MVEIESSIPDSLLMQYFGTSVSGGSLSWPDDNNVEDMTLTGDESDSTLSDGSDALNFDGDNDHGLIDLPAALEGSSLQEWSVEFSIQTTDSGENDLIGTRNSGDQLLLVRMNSDEDFDPDEGNFVFTLRTSDGRIDVSPTTNPSLNDGTRQDISLIINDSTQNDIDIIINGESVDLTFERATNPSDFGPWDEELGIAADNRPEGQFGFLEVDIGAIRWHDEAISGQTISDYGGSGNENSGSVTLTSTSIDTTAADGSQTIDMTDSGSQDILVGTDEDGEAVWYENDSNWTQNTIATGFGNIEGIDAADVDDDGDIEVFILDQDNGNLHVAKQDSSDPTGSWSTELLDESAPNLVHTLVMDVTGDGSPTDLVYSYEGTSNGNGGIYWQEYTGGSVLDSSNWSKHEIVQEEGGWGIARQPVDLSGDGNATDIVFGARTQRNSGASGGVWWAERPSDPTDPWTQHTIDTTDSALHVDVGDFSGDGNATDVLVGRFDDGTGVYWYDESDSWSQNTVTNQDTWWNVRAYPRSGSADDLILIERSGGTEGELQYWIEDGGDYSLEIAENLYKEVERLPLADLDGDGNDEFVTVSETGAVEYWEVDR